MIFYKSNIEKRMVLLLAGDVAISISSFVISVCKELENSNINLANYHFFEVKVAIFTISVLFISFFLELYRTKRIFDRQLILLRSLLAAITSFVSLSILFYLIPYLKIDGITLAFSLFIFFIFQCSWRILFFSLMKLPLFSKNTLILGAGAKAENIGGLMSRTETQYCLKGYISANFEPKTVPESQIIGTIDSFQEKVKTEKIHTIVMALSEQRGSAVINELLTSKLIGIKVMDFSSFYEIIAGKLPVESIEPSWLVYSHDFNLSPIIKVYKRVSDLFILLIGFFLSLPLFPVIALLIKLSSKGPVFYKQLRVGEREKNFYIYKFRTMKEDAEEKTGAVWAQVDDPRITKVGRLLRKTRLDELPQLINILKGEMSFIGPRPERPELAEKIKTVTSFYKERHFVKPGLTGWAQINYPYGASFGDAIEKLRYDLYYIKNMSFFLDLLIIMETIKVVLFRRGGR